MLYAAYILKPQEKIRRKLIILKQNPIFRIMWKQNLQNMNFGLIKQVVTQFRSDARTVDIECRLTWFSFYLTLSGIIFFIKIYIPLTMDESLRLI